MPQSANQLATTPNTAIDSILEKLAANNSQYVSLLNRLEDLGHKLRNTRTNESASKIADMPKEDGLVHEINSQLDYYISHNSRFEYILSKLFDII